jgi:hypothetical protein
LTFFLNSFISFPPDKSIFYSNFLAQLNFREDDPKKESEGFSGLHSAHSEVKKFKNNINYIFLYMTRPRCFNFSKQTLQNKGLNNKHGPHMPFFNDRPISIKTTFTGLQYTATHVYVILQIVESTSINPMKLSYLFICQFVPISVTSKCIRYGINVG